MPVFTFDTDRFATDKSYFPRLLQVLGILGVVFYAVGPIVFPDSPLRQPELLPVYTLMMGLGELLKRPTEKEKQLQEALGEEHDEVGEPISYDEDKKT